MLLASCTTFPNSSSASVTTEGAGVVGGGVVGGGVVGGGVVGGGVVLAAAVVVLTSSALSSGSALIRCILAGASVPLAGSA